MNDISHSEFEGPYFKTSWALLTQNKGWVKPILSLTAISFVPVVGGLYVLGYCLEWGRLIAWGVDGTPKQRGVKVGQCLRSGIRGALVIFCWTLLVQLAGLSLSIFLPSGGLLANLWSIIRFAATFVCALVAPLAALRATLFERFSAGLEVEQVLLMAYNDAGGLLRIFGIQLVWNAVSGFISAVASLAYLGASLPALSEFLEFLRRLYYGRVPSGAAVARAVNALTDALGPSVVVLIVFAALSATALRLILSCCQGFWYRQFGIGTWTTTDR